MNTSNLSTALTAWKQVLGEDGVLTGPDAEAKYAVDTGTVTRRIPAVLHPRNVEQVVACVRIAAKHGIPLYPVSTGNNWGYGTANPAVDDCVVVDLSGMDRIVDFDQETGLVTVEPGVTQQQLWDYLDAGRLPFLVPVTGAGPDCSLLGNALERGYGITPFCDHFGAVTWLEAVLPDGEIYQGALSALGGENVDRAYKWGVGPYVDGLFTQGAFGIVTKMTLALMPRPESYEAFFFSLRNETNLEAAILAIRDIVTSLGSLCGAINLMNRRRVLAMTVPYPELGRGEIMPVDQVEQYARRYRIFPWMGVGALYGTRGLVKEARRLVKARMKGVANQLIFLNPTKVRLAKRVAQTIPGLAKRVVPVTDRLEKTLDLLGGKPSDVALSLAYWRKGGVPPDRANPARDGCGLLWYAPLVPMAPESVLRFVEMVNRICPRYGIEPLITLTSLSPRCFDSTIPILFDRADPSAAAQANACYEALFAEGRKAGFLPYRMGIKHMRLIIGKDSPYWQLVKKIKLSVDPLNIISPGRYTPI